MFKLASTSKISFSLIELLFNDSLTFFSISRCAVIPKFFRNFLISKLYVSLFFRLINKSSFNSIIILFFYQYYLVFFVLFSFLSSHQAALPRLGPGQKETKTITANPSSWFIPGPSTTSFLRIVQALMRGR